MINFNYPTIDSLQPYILSFIPIFVAVDAIGNVPLFVSLVDGLSKKQRSRAISESLTTAVLIAVLFMFVGKLIFKTLGITVSDFQIAGGLLLFIIAARLLLPGSQKGLLAESHDKDVGVFPLGTPLITGPAVMTTVLIMRDSFGWLPTLVSLIINMLIMWITLLKADVIIKVIGSGGTRAFAKIMYILLAAIAVMLVRRGIIGGFSL